jgi:maleate cis-trans isomerase
VKFHFRVIRLSILKEVLDGNNARCAHRCLIAGNSNRPHFKSLDNILPPDVSIAHEGLGLLGDSYQDLAGKEDVIIHRARDLVRKYKVEGLMLTGGFVTLFNPGIEAKVAEAIDLPVVSSISSAVAALTTFKAKSALLMTPFDRGSNETIKTHVGNLGFTLHLGPSFDGRIPGTSLNLGRDQLFELVKERFEKTPAQAIYFQGATMDPLPILQKLEDALNVPVITSNSAMIWNVLSKLGLKYSVQGYGRLLQEWPA